MTSPSQISLQLTRPATDGTDLLINFIGIVNHFNFTTQRNQQFTNAGNSQLHITFPFNTPPSIRTMYPGVLTEETSTAVICSFFSAFNPQGSQFLPLHNWFHTEGRFLPIALEYTLPEHHEPVAVTLCILRDDALQSVQPHQDCPSRQIFDEEALDFTSQPLFPSVSPSCFFMGPIDPTVSFGPSCRLDASTKRHIIFVKLSTFLSTPSGCSSQQRGVRYFHIAALFPLHEQSYLRQRPLLEKPDGPLSLVNQLLGGRAKFVGFLDKSLLQSYPDDTASIPVVIPEDFNFFRLGSPIMLSPPPAPLTPTRPPRNGATVAGPVWRRRPNPPPEPPLTPSGRSLQPSPPSYTLGVPSTPSHPPSASPSAEAAPATFITATSLPPVGQYTNAGLDTPETVRETPPPVPSPKRPAEEDDVEQLPGSKRRRPPPKR